MPSLVERDHFCPDYQNLQDRIATFPFYWSYNFCNLLLRERLKIDKLEQKNKSEMSQWTDLLQNQKVQDTDEQPGISANNVPMEENSTVNLSVLDKIDESTKVGGDWVNRIMLDIIDNSTPQHFYSHP